MRHNIKVLKGFNSENKINSSKHLVLELEEKKSFSEKTINEYHNLLKFHYATKFITIFI